MCEKGQFGGQKVSGIRFVLEDGKLDIQVFKI